MPLIWGPSRGSWVWLYMGRFLPHFGMAMGYFFGIPWYGYGRFFFQFRYTYGSKFVCRQRLKNGENPEDALPTLSLSSWASPFGTVYVVVITSTTYATPIGLYYNTGKVYFSVKGRAF